MVADIVVNKVLQGDYPDDWIVLRGTRLAPWTSILFGILWTILSLLLVTISILCAGIVGLFGKFPYVTTPVALLVASIAGVTLSLTIGCYNTVRSYVQLHAIRNDPKPMLICTPDGVVEYSNSQTQLRSFRFRRLTKITINATASDSRHSNSVIYSLIFKDKVGHIETWKPRDGYGKASAEFMQAVIIAFARYNDKQEAQHQLGAVE